MFHLKAWVSLVSLSRGAAVIWFHNRKRGASNLMLHAHCLLNPLLPFGIIYISRLQCPSGLWHSRHICLHHVYNRCLTPDAKCSYLIWYFEWCKWSKLLGWGIIPKEHVVNALLQKQHLTSWHDTWQDAHAKYKQLRTKVHLEGWQLHF